MPTVSVVLPFYNAAATLDAALRSMLRQTLRDIEIIAVNDGSTDASADRVMAWAANDPRVHVLHRRHEGLVAALQAGLAAARAPLIARMDADDISHPERLSRQAHWLGRHPEFSLVGCNLIFGGTAAARGYAEHVCWINSLSTETDIANGRFVESPFAHPSVLFRREAMERWGGYRAGDFPEDYELWLRWMDGGARMGKLTDKLLTWNDPPARLSRTDTRYDTNAFYRIKAVYLARWLKAHLSSTTPSIVVEGAGPVTRRRAHFLEQQGVRIQAWVDVHPRRVGKHIHGVPVISPAARPPSAFIVSYVGNRGARDRIRRDLQTSGRVEGRDFICAA